MTEKLADDNLSVSSGREQPNKNSITSQSQSAARTVDMTSAIYPKRKRLLGIVKAFFGCFSRIREAPPTAPPVLHLLAKASHAAVLYCRWLQRLPADARESLCVRQLQTPDKLYVGVSI